MSKNIVILSDGTGQHSGVLFDENRSNIYKLYRATRVSPDSTIDPSEQFAFYDPGIGTLPPGLGFIGAISRRISNIVRQATGLGLTKNIVECYAAVIRNWSPGGRIFIFGFSRGAYTARCLAAVINLCGVPTKMSDGSPLKRDKGSSVRLAREAVTRIYQHVGSPSEKRFLPQRQALAERFRDQHGSGDKMHSNAAVHFIGVFDTVAAVARPAVVTALLFAGVAVTCLMGWILWYTIGAHWPWMLFAALIAIGAFTWYISTHLKWARGLENHSFFSTLHLNALRLQFYDTELSTRVGWARHAIAIDEHRESFNRVPWGNTKNWRRTGKGEPEWLEQIWFAGNHSDIGGSYPDSESRLSDIALQWMVSAAQAIPQPLKINGDLLRLYPDPAGMQHDETKSLAFRFTKTIVRSIKPDARLHPSVIARLSADSVLHYDTHREYRPEGLRKHKDVESKYSAN